MTAPTEDLIARLELFAEDWHMYPAHVELSTEAAQALRALQQEVERLRGLVGDFVRCEGDARHNPVGGLTLGGMMDCRANTGAVYQSADLADVIIRARSALTGSAQG